MTKNQNAKYKIGDLVIDHKNEYIGRIVKLYLFEDQWFYQLNNREELIPEHQLSLANNEKFVLHKKENIHIDYKFQFGDIVQVKGYGKDLFVVIGFRCEIWRYRNSAWEDLVYECSRLKDGEWLEATEEELVYITNEENAKRFFTTTQVKTLSPPKTYKHKEIIDVDTLLDMYNDYKSLYENFGEISYKKKMNEIIKKLEALNHYNRKNQ